MEDAKLVLVHIVVVVEIGCLTGLTAPARDRRSRSTSLERYEIVPIHVIVSVEVRNHRPRDRRRESQTGRQGFWIRSRMH